MNELFPFFFIKKKFIIQFFFLILKKINNYKLEKGIQDHYYLHLFFY